MRQNQFYFSFYAQSQVQCLQKLNKIINEIQVMNSDIYVVAISKAIWTRLEGRSMM